jgi:hypothetical protein
MLLTSASNVLRGQQVTAQAQAVPASSVIKKESILPQERTTAHLLRQGKYHMSTVLA